MARANFVKKAQKNIYTFGKHVQYIGKRGKREGMQMQKLDKTIPKDEHDPILIAKGESYYWWQFKNCAKQFSKGRPKNSQLTQSNYMSQLFEIMEGIEDINAEAPDDLVAIKDDTISLLENLMEETQSSLDNMPESLQSSPTGELLQDRISSLENAISELEGVDLDDFEELDEEQVRQEIIDGLDEDEDIQDLVDEKLEEHLREWLDEKTEELQGVSFE